MKTRTRFVNRVVLISSLVFLCAFTFIACNKDDNNDNNNTYAISGNASGSQVVPSVSGSGTATITGTYNASTNQLTYTTNWSNLTGGPTTAAFYSGATGVNGTIIGSSWALGSGLTATGSFSGTMTLTSDQETQLLNGDWYYLIGTTANSTGEVRGQITTTVQ